MRWRGEAGCAQKVHRKCRNGNGQASESVGGSWCRGCGEPREQTLAKFLGSSADCSAVVGAGNFPKNCVRILCVDAAGMAQGNVAVALTMNQEYRHIGGCN